MYGSYRSLSAAQRKQSKAEARAWGLTLAAVFQEAARELRVRYGYPEAFYRVGNNWRREELIKAIETNPYQTAEELSQASGMSIATVRKYRAAYLRKEGLPSPRRVSVLDILSKGT